MRLPAGPEATGATVSLEELLAIEKREPRILPDTSEGGRVAHWIDAWPGWGHRNPPKRRRRC